MSESVREVNEQDFDAAINAAKVVLADFWAPWCGPCRMVAPQVDAVAEAMAGEAAFIKVNVDDCPNLAKRFGVMSIPTMVVFQNGEEAARMVGARGRADIESAVREWL